MAEKIEMVHSYIPTEPQITVKLERGQKGTYAFEIKVEGIIALEVIEKIKNIDAILRREFCEKLEGEK